MVGVPGPWTLDQPTVDVGSSRARRRCRGTRGHAPGEVIGAMISLAAGLASIPSTKSVGMSTTTSALHHPPPLRLPGSIPMGTALCRTRVRGDQSRKSPHCHHGPRFGGLAPLNGRRHQELAIGLDVPVSPCVSWWNSTIRLASSAAMSITVTGQGTSECGGSVLVTKSPSIGSPRSRAAIGPTSSP